MVFIPKLELNNWPLIGDYLKAKTSIILPIGSTEQHGPSGLLGTDFLTPDAIALEVGKKTETLVAPTLPFGNAQHHMAFKGTISLRTETYIKALKDIFLSLSHHGFTHVFIINGHGGNIAPVTSALTSLYGDRTYGIIPASPLKGDLHNWWAGPQIQKLVKERIGDKEGMHATVSEVALTEFLFKEPIFNHPLGKAKDATSFSDFSDANDYRKNFPDGRIGCNLSPSTPELGKDIFEGAIQDAINALDNFAK